MRVSIVQCIFITNMYNALPNEMSQGRYPSQVLIAYPDSHLNCLPGTDCFLWDCLKAPSIQNRYQEEIKSIAYKFHNYKTNQLSDQDWPSTVPQCLENRKPDIGPEQPMICLLAAQYLNVPFLIHKFELIIIHNLPPYDFLSDSKHHLFQYKS